MIAEPQIVIPAAPPVAPAANHAKRSVMVVVDACCEIEPALAERLGMLILPRGVKIDGKLATLDSKRTLHHSCWEKLPRQCVPQPFELGPLAQIYERVLQDGVNVLAIHPPERFDTAARVALAARSILLAAQSSSQANPARVAVYETTTVGEGFAMLAQAAARAAAEGFSLHQLTMLLDRVQAATRSFFFTWAGGPPDMVRQAKPANGVGRFGGEAVWLLNGRDGRFECRARGWNLTTGMFGPQGALANFAPTFVSTTAPKQIERINSGRAALQLAPLEAQPGGIGVRRVFPRGCVELLQAPDAAQIAQISAVIRRIDRVAPPQMRGIRDRGGIL